MLRSVRVLGFVSLSAISLGLGCADATDKGPEDEVPLDGKLDTLRNPTDHGDLAFATRTTAELTAAGGFHSWQFTLSGDARVKLATSKVGRAAEVDTVLYLYKEGQTGWGSYLAKNDDARNTTVLSALDRRLGAGRYRALVKGYTARDRGKFGFEVTCDGAGCFAPVASGCLFGETYSDLTTGRPGLQIMNRETLTAASVLSALDQRQVVLAVQQSSHTDVRTAAEAFARVDGGEMNRVFLLERAAQRTFVAYEYGAGDNSYGAVFHRSSTELATAIHDGDLERCTVRRETCGLGATYRALLANPAFQVVSSRMITRASDLTGVEAEQAVRAVQVSNDSVHDLAGALAAVDDGRLNLTLLSHRATNAELLAIEFGAGDTSVGAIFYAGSLQLAGLIQDGDLDACSLFVPQGGLTAGATCRGPGDCVTGLSCQGLFAGGGKCVSTVRPPSDGSSCSADSGCGTGAICAGATRGYGLCGSAWMRGSFEAPSSSAIPDAGALVTRVAARGLGTVDTDVVLRATIHHPRPSQLRVTLRNPASAEVVVFEGTGAADRSPELVLDGPVLGFSGDESVNGEWTLIVTDRSSGHIGTLDGWTLTLTSRWD